VIGENGHGKTNLLEAIYYLQLLRSLRGARDPDLVRFGADGFHVAARASVDGPREIAAGFERAGKRKRVRIDGLERPRLSDALGALPAVIFSPRDVELVAGAPSERRRYLDVLLALTSRRYLAALQGYRGALVRRNAALREAARTGRGDGRIAVWESPLAEHGALLWRERMAWVEEVAPRFADLCAAIGERTAVRMRYTTSLAPTGDPAAALGDALAAQRPQDLRRGVTHAGPHRDDLTLTIAGPEGTPRELRAFGSAGQQRTAAIALRMLEAATLRERGGSEPILLLDDPFAELDARRSARILQLLADGGMGQTILTVPRPTDIPPELTRLERRRIHEGALEPWFS
jgi:DNA replication and repair protein RecF